MIFFSIVLRQRMLQLWKCLEKEVKIKKQGISMITINDKKDSIIKMKEPIVGR